MSKIKTAILRIAGIALTSFGLAIVIPLIFVLLLMYNTIAHQGSTIQARLLALILVQPFIMDVLLVFIGMDLAKNRDVSRLVIAVGSVFLLFVCLLFTLGIISQ